MNSKMSFLQTAYCRLCASLKPYNKLSEFATDDENCTEIITKLSCVDAEIDFNSNILPKTVCFVCLSTLERVYEFVSTVKQAQVTLKKVILELHVKKEDDHSGSEYFTHDSSDVKYEDAIEVNVKTECEETVQCPEQLRKVSSKSKNLSKSRKNKSVSNILDAIPLAELKLTWKDYNWECWYCGTQFPHIDELKAHSIQYHNCCNAYRCTDCKLRKFCLDSFLIHVRRHKKHLKLCCYICCERFLTPHETNLHRKIHITSEFVCKGCNTSFVDIDELSRHTTELYNDKRARQLPIQRCNTSLTCSICQKSFKNKNSVNKHMLTHTERPRDHICEVCGKCFLHKQNLECHILQHSDARPHKCEICKQSFKTASQLRNHVGVHDGGKPYSCEQCGKCFRLQKQLASHSIIHTDSLPYVCSYCNKSFRFKTILNQHIRQHTGVKPYSCSICQREFTNWPNYNKHMKRRHGTDMAKKKHTPNGLYPIDPKTGEVINYPEIDKMEDWKRTMMQRRRPGRPKLKSENEKNVKCNTNNND